MQRYLSIVLDYNCIISKTLIEDSKYELDNYISNTFNNSNDVRKKYEKEIATFLYQNKDLIKHIEEKNNKIYRGQIVILQVLEDGQIQRIKVIYKDDLKKVKELIKNQYLMRNFVLENKRYFSQYIINKIKKNLSKTDYEKMINEWYRQIKNTTNYYEMCRYLIKFNDTQLCSKNPKLENIAIDENNEDDNFNIDIDYENYKDLYSRNYDECIETYDNDLNDEEKPQTKKLIKRRKNPDQLSFFD